MDQKEKDLQRIIFLRLFTKEILLSLIERERSKQSIESEKVKQKIFQDYLNNSEEVLKTIITDIDPETKEHKRITMIHRENVPANLPTYPLMEHSKEKKNEKKLVQEVNNQPGMEKSISQEKEKSTERTNSTQRMDIKKLLGRPMKINNLPPMEKIEPLIRDNTILTIECPGPGKNIMVRKYNQVNMTKMVLSEEEIKSVIEYFARAAKIPLAGGILKAAVGNSVISAVVSEFVGSRFVINKITPYSLLGSR